MFRRIGFRRLLPVVATAFYAVCVLQAFPTYKLEADQRREMKEGFQTREGMVSIDPPPARLPGPLTAAVTLALPAVIVGGTLAIVVRKFLATPTWFEFLAIGFFVPVFWYLIGRWVDCIVGFLPRPGLKYGSNFVAAHILGLLFCLLLSVFFLFAIVTNAHGNVAAIMLVPWTTLGALVLWERLRRYRQYFSQ